MLLPVHLAESRGKPTKDNLLYSVPAVSAHTPTRLGHETPGTLGGRWGAPDRTFACIRSLEYKISLCRIDPNRRIVLPDFEYLLIEGIK